MREKYKISQVAKLFNISRRTLIYYDEIGLFKPDYIDLTNNYRYYSAHQLYDLYFLIALKDSGFSLGEIKEYSNSKNIQDSLDFLDTKLKLIDFKISELEKYKQVIARKKEELKKILSSEGIEPSIVYNKHFRVFFISVAPPYTHMEVTNVYKKLQEIEIDLKLKNKTYITIIDKKNLEENDFYPVKKIGIVIPNNKEYKNISYISYKKLASITHKDSYENLESTYKVLIDFINKNSYKINDDSIEVTNELMLQFEEGIGGIIEILIPID